MKTPVLFKTFNYSLVPPAVMVDRSETIGKMTENAASLVNVNIDFELEDFKLEGDWKYIMSSNKHAEQKWFDCHRQRVSIEANIYPGITIDLSDDNNDGLVFIIEGTIKDNDNTDNCSGLLVLDKILAGDEKNAAKWNISFYLYDSAHDDCEIAFRFPVYGKQTNDLLN